MVSSLSQSRHASKCQNENCWQLAADPYPKGARKLTGYDDVFRIRVGRYRVLYSVSAATVVSRGARGAGPSHERVVVVLKIGQRKDVYRP